MGFTKLDDGLVFSSLMDEDDAVFKVWIIMLSLTKADGICPVSPVFLAKITGKDLEEIERCVHVLVSPDSSSRTKDHDGRRIEPVDGGYFVLNYQKYRETSVTEYERDRKRKQRSRGTDCPGTVPGPSASASSSASDLALKGSKDNPSRKDSAPTWRNTFDVYLEQEQTALDAMLADEKWLADMQRLNTGIDVSLSLEKARRYWRSEEAWAARKKKRAATINWRRTYENALSSKMNRVYPPRDTGSDPLNIVKRKEPE